MRERGDERRDPDLNAIRQPRLPSRRISASVAKTVSQAPLPVSVRLDARPRKKWIAVIVRVLAR
jgi:hypothetical protein